MNRMYISQVGSLVLPVAYELGESKKVVYIDSLLANELPEGLANIWCSCETDLGYAQAEWTIPILCKQEGDDLIPLYCTAYDGQIELSDMKCTEDLIERIDRASETIKPDKTSIVCDYDSLYQGYYISYVARVIREVTQGEGYEFDEGESLETFMSTLKEYMDTSEDYYYKETYDKAVAKLKADKQPKVHVKTESMQPASESSSISVNKEKAEESIKLAQQIQSFDATSQDKTSQSQVQPQTQAEASKVQISQPQTTQPQSTQSQAKTQIAQSQATQTKAQPAPTKSSPTATSPKTGSVESNEKGIAKFSRKHNFITDKSGSCVPVNEFSDEEIEAVSSQIVGVGKLLKSLDVPAFIPRVNKFERPVGVNIGRNPSVLAGISYDQFLKYIQMYVNLNEADLKGNPVIQTFVSEVLYLLHATNTGTSFQDILYTFEDSEATGWSMKALYELLCYEVVDESPNDLYDNMYPFLYLTSLYLQEKGETNTMITFKLANILTRLACNVKESESYEDYSGVSEDASLDETESSIVSNAHADVVNMAGNAMSSLLQDIITSKAGTDMRIPLSGGEDLSRVQKICILGRYGYRFYIKDTSLHYQGLDYMNVIIGEYDLILSYFSEPMDPTILGAVIGGMRIRASSMTKYGSIYYGKSTDECLEILYKKGDLKDLSYNHQVSAFKNPKMVGLISSSTASAIKIEELSFEGLNLLYGIITKIESKGKSKIVPVAYVLEDTNPGVSALEKFKIFPTLCASYGTMLESGIQIKDLLNGPESVSKHISWQDNRGILQDICLLKVPPKDKCKYVSVKSMDIITNLTSLKEAVKKTPMSGVTSDALAFPKWLNYDTSIQTAYSILFR